MGGVSRGVISGTLVSTGELSTQAIECGSTRTILEQLEHTLTLCSAGGWGRVASRVLQHRVRDGTSNDDDQSPVTQTLPSLRIDSCDTTCCWSCGRRVPAVQNSATYILLVGWSTAGAPVLNLRKWVWRLRGYPEPEPRLNMKVMILLRTPRLRCRGAYCGLAPDDSVGLASACEEDSTLVVNPAVPAFHARAFQALSRAGCASADETL